MECSALLVRPHWTWNRLGEEARWRWLPIERHYTAKVRPTITDEGWAEMPSIVKRAIVGGLLEQSISHVLNAAQEGGFDRENAHHSRTAGPLDTKGWKAVSRELASSLKRI